MINVKIIDSEIVSHLEGLPKKLQKVLYVKMQNIIDQIYNTALKTMPGPFLDPSYISHGVEELGSNVIGFIEGQDKLGVYGFVAQKAKALSFVAKSGDFVITKAVYNHPFLKSTPHLQRIINESKSWISDSIEDAIIEAL
jgi:hypothetical protein